MKKSGINFLLSLLFAGGWVHGVSFSASGNKLAWVGHDSSISVVNAANDNKLVTIQGDFLPFLDCVWITENSIVTAGNSFVFQSPGQRGSYGLLGGNY